MSQLYNYWPNSRVPLSLKHALLMRIDKSRTSVTSWARLAARRAPGAITVYMPICIVYVQYMYNIKSVLYIFKQHSAVRLSCTSVNSFWYNVEWMLVKLHDDICFKVGRSQ